MLAALLLLATSPAIEQIAKQFDDHSIVMIGELHRWSELHEFLRELLRTPEFICRADDVVVEFGNSRLQKIADEFASGSPVSEAQIQSLWRETAVPLTWNSPVYRQFLDAVREINTKHLCDHPVRLVLADPPLDWTKIHNAKEYEPWTDRDGSMANVIEREVLAKHRRAFFLAGQFHAEKKSTDGEPRAVQLIERAHPGAIFCVVAVTGALAKELHLAPPPSFTIAQGELARAKFPAADEEAKFPPLGEVVDGVLNIEGRTFVYPPPSLYLEPAYLAELRRRVAIHKEVSGQDFGPGIDALVKAAQGP
jgi:hypothetical protein